MSKSDFHNLFNEKLLEFSKDLCNVFPSVGEFKKFRSGVLMLQNIDPKTLENMFNMYVVSKYRGQLLKKDESFFLDHTDFSVEPQRTDHWLALVDQLKHMWKTLDDDNKEIIWKYFHVLIVLSEKCHAS